MLILVSMYYAFILILSVLSAAPFNGRVVDKIGYPIPFVNIEIVDCEAGASSDQDGYFQINKRPSENFTIKVSHIGYYNQFLDINLNDNDIIIQLDKKVEFLNQLVVTGERREVYIKDTPILTRVINSRDIENSSYTSVKDILEMSVPNIQNVVSSHAGTSNNNVKIQGLDNRYILFLIDGARVSGEFAGNLDFNMLDLSDVERIEIVDGGVSSLYGSSAIGGVVNIISKKRQKPISFSLSMLNEDPVIASTSINLGLTYKNFHYNVNFVNQKTDGYDLTPQDSNVVGALSKTQEEYVTNSVSHKIRYNFNLSSLGSSGLIELNYKEYSNFIYQYENHLVQVLDDSNPSYPFYYYQSYVNNSPRFKDYRYGAIFKIDTKNTFFKLPYHTERYKKYSYFFNYEESACDQFGVNCDNLDELVSREILNANSYGESIVAQYNLSLSSHELMMGAEVNKNRYSSFNVYYFDHNNDGSCGEGTVWDPNDCWSQSIFNEDGSKNYIKKAIFIGDQITFENDNKLNISIRNTDSKNFGNGLVYSSSFITKTLFKDFSLRLSANRGFRTPSIKELYYNYQSHPPPVIGNPNLKATTNDYLSISFDRRNLDSNISFDFFYNYIVDMIGIVSAVDDLGEEVLQYDNYKNVTFKGFNFHYEKMFNGKDRLKFFYNYTLPESSSNSALELISKNSLRLQYDKFLSEKIKIVSSIKYLSAKDVFIGDSMLALDEYIMSEIVGIFNFTESVSVKIGCKNLFNYKDDRRFSGVNEDILTSYDPGRRFFIGFNFNY